MRCYPALKAALLLTAGIVAGYWLNLPTTLWAVAAAATLAGAIITTRQPAGTALLLASLFSAGGFLWSTAPASPPFASIPMRVEGVIAEIPAHYSNQTAFPLKIDRITTPGQPAQSFRFKAWCRIPQTVKNLQAGQRIELDGRLQPLDPPRNPGDFDLESWRERNGYRSVFQAGQSVQITILDPSPPFIHHLRSHIYSRIDRCFGDSAPLMQAVLLGFRREMDRQFYDALRLTGLAHLVALSGLHVGFLMAMLLGLGTILRLRYGGRILLGLAGLLLFIIIVPPRASTLRASVMSALFLCAPLLRRWSPAGNTLAFSALVTLILRPGDLFDAGFQLSYAAVGGILLFHRDIDHYLRLRTTRDRRFRRFLNRYAVAALGVSAAASALVMPLVSRHFNMMTPGAVLFNLVAIPLMQFIYTGGCISIAVSFLSSWCGGYLADATQVLIHALEASTRLFADISPVMTTRLAPLTVGLILGTTVWTSISRRVVWVRYALALTAIIGLLMLDDLRPIPLHTQAWFLDVGQGDAALLLFPNGRTVVIDGGPPPSPGQDSPLVGALSRYQRRKIDLMIASHLEADHIGGLIPLVEKYPVTAAITCAKRPALQIYQRLMRWSADKGLAWRNVCQGDSLGGIMPGFRGVIFNPPPASVWSANDQSVAVLFDFTQSDDSGGRMLFTGDIERIAENALAGSLDVRAGVLKAPHHGNLTSSSDVFLDAVDPTYAVISSGTRYESNMRVNLARYRERGIKTHATLDEGAALFEVSQSDGRWIWQPRNWRQPSFGRWLLGWD